MKRLLVRRSAAGLALAALAATGLASVPASANAAVSNAFVGTEVEFDEYDGCTRVGAVDGPGQVAWSDNGVPVSQAYSNSGTFTDPVNLSDVVDTSASGSVTVSSTPFTGGAFTLTGSASASASVNARLGSTDCDVYASANPGAYGTLVLPQPMWVTLSGTGDGNGYGSAGVEAMDGGAYLGIGKRGSASTTALLPAGEVGIYFSVSASDYAYDANNSTPARSYAGSFKIELQPVGAATAPTGKGKGFTQFGARDCANGNIAAAITKKAKKKAEQVLIKVNGAKAAKFKGKKLKKRTLVLPAAPSSAAEVVATITLKNGKKVTVTRSYLACS